MEYRDFLSKEKNKENKSIIIENKSILQDFIISKSELSDDGLTALVVLKETNNLIEQCKKELLDFKLIYEENSEIKLSEIGNNFLKEEKTLNRIIKLIED